jgi:hypothetical protein
MQPVQLKCRPGCIHSIIQDLSDFDSQRYTVIQDQFRFDNAKFSEFLIGSAFIKGFTFKNINSKEISCKVNIIRILKLDSSSFDARLLSINSKTKTLISNGLGRKDEDRN